MCKPWRQALQHPVCWSNVEITHKDLNHALSTLKRTWPAIFGHRSCVSSLSLTHNTYCLILFFCFTRHNNPSSALITHRRRRMLRRFLSFSSLSFAFWSYRFPYDSVPRDCPSSSAAASNSSLFSSLFAHFVCPTNNVVLLQCTVHLSSPAMRHGSKGEHGSSLSLQTPPDSWGRCLPFRFTTSVSSSTFPESGLVTRVIVCSGASEHSVRFSLVRVYLQVFPGSCLVIYRSAFFSVSKFWFCGLLCGSSVSLALSLLLSSL